MSLNFKKISAVLASGLMAVSGIGFAAAASYPAPFVSGSTADVAIVYGTNADNLDVVAAGNIQDDLSDALGTTGTTGTTTTGGDSVLLAKSSDNINVGNMWSVFTGTIDEDDLSTLLADGTYIADDNDEFDYEQKIIIGNPNMSQFRDSDYESAAGLTERTPVLGFKISSSTWIMNYTLDFTSDAESDIVSDDLDDIEGSDLPLFGKTYYVSNLDNGTGTVDFFGKLTLLDSATKETISEGETIDVMLDGTTYSVSLNFIGSSTVKFDVNGEITNTLSAGETFKLADGSYIGVREINTQDYQGGIKTVEFSIGSGKLEITSGSDIKLNDDTVQGVKGWVYEKAGSSGSEKIDKIVIEWKTDEEEFLTPGLELLMPGFEAIKFTMGDIVRSTEEKIVIEKESDTNVELTAPIKDGTVSFPLLYANATGDFIGLGKAADERLATSGNTTLTFYEKNSGSDYHKWFVASYNTTSEAESYLLRAKVTYDSGDNRNETTIDKNVDGTWETVCEEKIATDTCDLGQVSLTIDAIRYTSGGNESIDITAGTDVNFNTLYTDGGLRIYLPYLATSTLNTATAGPGSINVSAKKTVASGVTWNHSEAGSGFNTYYLYMDGEDKDDNIAGGTQFYLTLDDTTDNNLYVSQVQGAGSGGGSTIAEEVGDSTGVYQAYIVDDVAPRILHYTKPDEDYAEVYYPTGDSETYAEIYLAETNVVVSSEGGTSALGEVLVTDAEVSSVQTKNLIVVGGSCINSAAATLLGGAYCTTDFTEKTGVGAGQYIIKGYSGAFTAGKIALLVAGYEAADTTNAQKYLTSQTVDTSKEYIGTSATEATMQ